MRREIHYGPRERTGLILLSAAGFLLLNAAFLYGVLARPGALADALANPVSVAFIAESLLLVGVLAWLIGRWGVSRLHWGWFVALSLIGGIAFALPIVLLWRRPGASGPTG